MSTTNNNNNAAAPSTLHKLALPILFSIALLLSLIEFIITAVLVHDYSVIDYPSNSIRDRLRFLLFMSCWCLLLLPIYIFANLRLPRQVLSSVASNLGFTSLTWLFLLAGAASWTDALGGNLHCHNMFFQDQVIITRVPYCGSLRGVQAFAWMLWLTFSAALLYISSVAMWAKKQSSGLTGPMREVSV